MNNDGQRLGQIITLGALLSIVLVMGWKTKDPKHAKKYKELSAKREELQSKVNKSMQPTADASAD